MTAAHMIPEAQSGYDDTLTVFAAAAIDTASTAMTMVDREGTIVHLNDAARSLIQDHADGFRETLGLRGTEPSGDRIDLSAVVFPQRRANGRDEIRTGEVTLGDAQLSVRISPVRSGP
ncbi:MAG: hypothetical protein EON96_15310, partial [Caulobacteraceae bacterium]